MPFNINMLQPSSVVLFVDDLPAFYVASYNMELNYRSGNGEILSSIVVGSPIIENIAKIVVERLLYPKVFDKRPYVMNLTKLVAIRLRAEGLAIKREKQPLNLYLIQIDSQGQIDRTYGPYACTEKTTKLAFNTDLHQETYRTGRK